MPRWVQNGTEDSIVLDCEYDYTEEDNRLVVKWFLNDDPQPIYQWIPELNLRSASHRLQGRLNMDYTVSPSSQHTRYRALNILRPTTELSGRYSCHVVSMKNQDAEEQVMVVYAPPRSFDFNFTKMSSETVNFTCEADGVFPMPKITLLQVDIMERVPTLVSNVKTVINSHRSTGAYYVQVSREIRERELTEEPTLFQCILSIPGTDYENEKSIIYYPARSRDSLETPHPSDVTVTKRETNFDTQSRDKLETQLGQTGNPSTIMVMNYESIYDESIYDESIYDSSLSATRRSTEESAVWIIVLLIVCLLS